MQLWEYIKLMRRENSINVCCSTMAAINDCGFSVIEDPPYSPDLAPSDFHLYPDFQYPILVRWWRDACSGGLSERSREKLLYKWPRDPLTSLAKVYRYWRRLWCKNNAICPQKVKTLLWGSQLINQPSYINKVILGRTYTIQTFNCRVVVVHVTHAVNIDRYVIKQIYNCKISTIEEILNPDIWNLSITIR